MNADFLWTGKYALSTLQQMKTKPYTTVHNKNHLEKLHFLVALAQPRYDSGRQKWFDSKIGIWPFDTKGEAV